MNIRKRLSAILAGSAVLTSLAIGFTAQPAAAATCEIWPAREIRVQDVKVVEGNPVGPFGFLTAMEFKVETFGCLTEGTLEWKVMPPSIWEDLAPASWPDYYRPNNEHPRGTLTWGADDGTTKTVRVFIMRDTQRENTEHLQLYITKKSGFPINVDLGPAATGFILDDDGPVPA